MGDNTQSSIRGTNPAKTKGLKVNFSETTEEEPLTPPSTCSPQDISSSSLLEDESPDGEQPALFSESQPLLAVPEEEEEEEQSTKITPNTGDLVEEEEGHEDLASESSEGRGKPEEEMVVKEQEQAEREDGASSIVGTSSHKASTQNCTQGVIGNAAGDDKADSNQSGHKVENHMFTPEIHLMPGDGETSSTCETSM